MVRNRVISTNSRPRIENERAGIGSLKGRVAISRPDDECEREADRVSDRLSSVPDGTRPDRRDLRINQSKLGHAESTEVFPALERLRASVGRPLDSGTREQMESQIPFNFGRVRIHDNETAHQAAIGLSARAFTLGSEIGFAPGQYAPNSLEGRKLLAHELTHVVQQSADSRPVLRRSPMLKGKSQQLFGDSDAPTIDKAIATSPITKWVAAKKLIKLTGNFETQDPVVFEEQFKSFGKSDESVDEVPGFVDRTQKKPVRLRLPGRNAARQLVTAAQFETAVHETIHLNSNANFRNNFGHSYNEGVTQYFTELVLGESGKAYRDRIRLAEGLLAVATEDDIGKAYFQGDRALYTMVVKALGQKGTTGFSDWFKAREKEPPDWQTANSLLQSAFAASNQPAATATPPKSVPTEPKPASK